MEIKVSIGEVLDKISILNLKMFFIEDELKLDNVKKELDYLLKKCEENQIKYSEIESYLDLYEINKKLWEVEDNIRIKESKKTFDQEFIELARSVYRLNDIRANIKKYINTKYKSEIIEEKSYEKY